jgi:putative N6-adenine-specific DNA methylase
MERIYAVTAPGLESITAAELAELGITAAASVGGVEWEGPAEQAYLANLRLRTASRVVVRIGEFRARTFFELERHARKLPWARFIARGARIRLRVTSKKSKLYHEGAIAQRLAEAAERAIGALHAEEGRSDDDSDAQQSEAQLFIVRMWYDRCTVSVDTSGRLLHQRGYRQATAKAPLRETIAAAMLLGSGWRGQAPLIDPMCGSGTIPIEAALIARRIAPGLACGAGAAARGYAFEQWPDFDRGRWQALIDEARSEVRAEAGVPLQGRDRDAGAVAAARENAERAGVLDDVSFEHAAISSLRRPAAQGWLVINPPYGVRVGERDPLRDLYASVGRLARSELSGWKIVLLSADPQLEAQIRLGFTEILRTRNGGIPVRLIAADAGTGG